MADVRLSGLGRLPAPRIRREEDVETLGTDEGDVADAVAPVALVGEWAVARSLAAPPPIRPANRVMPVDLTEDPTA